MVNMHRNRVGSTLPNLGSSTVLRIRGSIRNRMAGNMLRRITGSIRRIRGSMLRRVTASTLPFRRTLVTDMSGPRGITTVAIGFLVHGFCADTQCITATDTPADTVTGLAYGLASDLAVAGSSDILVTPVTASRAAGIAAADFRAMVVADVDLAAVATGGGNP